MEEFCVLLVCAVVAAVDSLLEHFGDDQLVAWWLATDAGDKIFIVKPFLSELLHDVPSAHFEFVFGLDSSSGFEIVILKLLGDDCVLSF